MLNTNSNPTIESVGIGLFICNKLAELMGQEIGFETEIGKGSRFYIKLNKERKFMLKKHTLMF